MSLRSYGDESRQMLIDKIKRTTKGIAISVGVAEEDFPVVEVRKHHTPSVYNDPAFTAMVADVFHQLVGSGNVEELDPLMVGEYFGHYTRVDPAILTLLYLLGSVPKIDPETGEPPANFTHSSKYRPVVQLGLKTGILSMSAAIIRLLQSERLVRDDSAGE